MKPPLRIGFCGAGGTGKTTTVELMQKLGLQVPVLKSASRTVYEREDLTEEIVGKMSLEEAWALQFRIFQEKVEMDKAPQFIADRTLLDHYAYCLLYCNKIMTNEEWEDFEGMVKDHMSRSYSHIFYFPFGLFDPPDDGVRNFRKAWQVTIDAILRGYLSKWNLFYATVPKLEPEARAMNLLQIVRRNKP